MSRAGRPKQFLALAGKRSLIEETWRRVRRLVPPERIWVVAPKRLARDVRRALPDLLRGNLVAEPSPRDTAPAIALACATVLRRDPRAVTAFLPTDHLVRDTAAFARAVRVAAREARAGSLVCLGIKPTRPATGFGYLQCATRPAGVEPVAVRRFVEKPDLARARTFVRSGKFLWNAGMFLWRADRFLDELRRLAPATHDAAVRTAAGDRAAWERAERKSVDYAVMERVQGVRVVPLDAGWDDIGSWDAVAALRSGSDGILVDSPDSVVLSGGRCVAVVGAPGLVVVETGDAVLVVGRGASEKVRRVVDALRSRGRADLL
jgi:mannose-1-phosphate guanylyltransferase